MRFRPERLIEKLTEKLPQLSLYGREHRAVGLVSKEFLGEQDVVAIETDCHTFIAEGLASHNCYLANFWRSLQRDPEAVSKWADWPVNEADLHARHRWLVNQAKFPERMKTDPDFYDVKVAGWWVWGICQWIGSGWCERPDWEGRTNAGRPGRGILSQQIPRLGGNQGINREISDKRPMLSGHGHGVGVHSDRAGNLIQYFNALAERLREVRVCCGEWDRVLGHSVTIKGGVCGVFLDPPYDMRVVSNKESGRDGAAPTDRLYANHDSNLSALVRDWAVANGDNPQYRIALCGYEGEHQVPDSWECVPWKAHGGYGIRRQEYENNARERIWFSPHCLKGQGRLFEQQEQTA
jgi:hypothetical protein